MSPITSVETVSKLIQTALSPMFLLSAIGTSLLVIDNRLNRIVDRARHLESRISGNPELAQEMGPEAKYYSRRAKDITYSVALCTLAALSVALVVILLFVDIRTGAELTTSIEAFFTLAVVVYVFALGIYLRDVFRVKKGIEFTEERINKTCQAPTKPSCD